MPFTKGNWVNGHRKGMRYFFVCANCRKMYDLVNNTVEDFMCCLNWEKCSHYSKDATTMKTCKNYKKGTRKVLLKEGE